MPSGNRARPAFGAPEHVPPSGLRTWGGRTEGPIVPTALKMKGEIITSRKEERWEWGLGGSSKNGQEKNLTILMQEEEKSEGCIPTKASKRKEWQTRPQLCLLSHPRTKVGLLTGPFRERGADEREGNKDLDFLLDLAEKEGKLIKCSDINKYCGTGGNWKHGTASRTQEPLLFLLRSCTPLPTPSGPGAGLPGPSTARGPLNTQHSNGDKRCSFSL